VGRERQTRHGASVPCVACVWATGHTLTYAHAQTTGLRGQRTGLREQTTRLREPTTGFLPAPWGRSRGLQATTSHVPSNTRTHSPSSTRWMRMALSAPADASSSLLGLNATQSSASVCPVSSASSRQAFPVSSSATRKTHTRVSPHEYTSREPSAVRV
jgi:hypothetical protein